MITLNYFAVLVAAIISGAIGALWYGGLFRKQWMSLMGLSTESMKGMKLSGKSAMGINLVADLVLAYVVAHFVAMLNIVDAVGAWQFAFWAWLGLMMPIILGSFLWEAKSLKLVVINGAYRLVQLVVVAMLLTWW